MGFFHENRGWLSILGCLQRLGVIPPGHHHRGTPLHTIYRTGNGLAVLAVKERSFFAMSLESSPAPIIVSAPASSPDQHSIPTRDGNGGDSADGPLSRPGKTKSAMVSVSKSRGVAEMFPPAQLHFQDSRPLPVEFRISLRRKRHSSVLAAPSALLATTFAVSLNRCPFPPCCHASTSVPSRPTLSRILGVQAGVRSSVRRSSVRLRIPPLQLVLPKARGNWRNLLIGTEHAECNCDIASVERSSLIF